MKPFTPNVFTELRKNYGINYKADEKREADKKDQELKRLRYKLRAHIGHRTRRLNNEKKN